MRFRRRSAAALAAAAVVTTLAAPSQVGAATSRGSLVMHVTVTITGNALRSPLPPDFLGLALEYNTIPRWVGPAGTPVDTVLLQLLRNLDPAGHPVLRVGGQSADRSWWPAAGQSKPLGVTYALTPAWAQAARALAQASGARYLLGINLEADRPALDQVEARQLLAGVGPASVAALELGNEPDLYGLVPWYKLDHGRRLPWYLRIGTPVFARGPGYGPAQYASQLARVLRVLPAAPLAGPETGLPPWMDAFTKVLHRSRFLTSHAYGLNQCVTDPSLPGYPSVLHLLAPAASRNLTPGITPYLARAHRAGAAYRIDEMGAITCNGRPGVSDTMAAALWALDALFAVAASGVDGINLHTYPDNPGGLFDLAAPAGRWQASVHPIYYGALMFAQAAPPGARLLQVSSAGPAQLRAWATAGADHRLRVVLINDSIRARGVASVTAPQRSAAALERLTASSAYARAGIALGGSSFGAQTTTGALPAPELTALKPRGSTYTVALPPASAALLTVPGYPYP